MLPLARSGLLRARPSPPLALRSAFGTSASRRRTGPLTNVVTTPHFISKVQVVPEELPTSGASKETIPSFRVLDGEGNILPDVQGQWRSEVEAVRLAWLLPALEMLMDILFGDIADTGRSDAHVRSDALPASSRQHPLQLPAAGPHIFLHVSLSTLKFFWINLGV
jgi:hypothetical protein